MSTLPLRRKFKLGLIINPYAGIGGALALKGSDGASVRARALNNGAERLAMQKAQLALAECRHLSDTFEVYTGSSELGETTAKALGLGYHIVYSPTQAQTESDDTMALVAKCCQHNVDLLLFVGGDGTARNVCEALNSKYSTEAHANNAQLAVLGVPAGCKIHSGVYAITPRAAGKVLSKVISGELVSLQVAEVRDIDEARFREGTVIAKHFGEMHVPLELNYIQAVKMGGKESDELLLDDIAQSVIDSMDEYPEHCFVMGSGSTVDAIMQYMHLPNTLLGVDVVLNSQLIASDVTASDLISLQKQYPLKVVVTLIGGQGHIFGRGNQQLSAQFLAGISREDLWIVATKTKLQSLNNRGLISDTGDDALDAKWAGPISIITGYQDQVLYFIRGEE
ncbi:MAG: ATP-NAD kinase family protein [Glaciecola sp.]